MTKWNDEKLNEMEGPMSHQGLLYRQGRTTYTRAIVIKPPPQKGGVMVDHVESSSGLIKKLTLTRLYRLGEVWTYVDFLRQLPDHVTSQRTGIGKERDDR